MKVICVDCYWAPKWGTFKLAYQSLQCTLSKESPSFVRNTQHSNIYPQINEILFKTEVIFEFLPRETSLYYWNPKLQSCDEFYTSWCEKGIEYSIEYGVTRSNIRINGVSIDYTEMECMDE